ncbi:MAG: histidinol-phosphate transaminase [Candidatus Poribacteria bacterium]|nr:histidinol-phosphate transaminase [Candidatus Poribacteria bacterium]
MKAKPGIETIQPYQGGKPIEEVQRELGLTDIIKLASNENPLGPSSLALEAGLEAVAQVNLYPDGNAYYLKQALAEHVGVASENLILGNGSNEVLQIVGETYISPHDEVIYSESAFVVYMLVAKVCGAKSIVTPMRRYTHDLEAMADAITDKTRLIFIANPNNPTGTMVTKEQTKRFMEQVPEDVLVIFDEAYYEYVGRLDYPQTLPYVEEGRNVIITRTFSKIYGLAGMRIGYGIAKPELIETMNRVRQPFNCNSVAQAAARAALKDVEHVHRSQRLNASGKVYLYESLDQMGLGYVESEGNFILVHFDQSGQEIADALMQKGVIVRPVAGYGFPNSIRVTIGKPEENERFVNTLKEVMSEA